MLVMVDAHEEIMNILSQVEDEISLPKGTLKQIYDAENSVVHLRVRDSMYDKLQGIVSSAAKEMKEDAV